MASSPSPATGLAHAAATGVSAAAVVVLTEVLPQPVAADATAAAPPPPPPLKPLPLSESPFAFTSLLGAVLLLAIIGGYLDAVFFLTVGVFVGLQTGNVIQIACAVVSPSGDRLAELRLAALAAWVVGLLAGGAAGGALARAGAGRRATLAILFTVNVALIGAALAVGASLAASLPGAAQPVATAPAFAAACVGALACGFLPPALRQLLPAVPMIFNQTGNFIALFDDAGVAAAEAAADALSAATAAAAAAAARRRRMATVGATCVGFLGGAFAGAAVTNAISFPALGVPLALLAFLAADALTARLRWGEAPAPAPPPAALAAPCGGCAPLCNAASHKSAAV